MCLIGYRFKYLDLVAFFVRYFVCIVLFCLGVIQVRQIVPLAKSIKLSYFLFFEDALVHVHRAFRMNEFGVRAKIRVPFDCQELHYTRIGAILKT